MCLASWISASAKINSFAFNGAELKASHKSIKSQISYCSCSVLKICNFRSSTTSCAPKLGDFITLHYINKFCLQTAKFLSFCIFNALIRYKSDFPHRSVPMEQLQGIHFHFQFNWANGAFSIFIFIFIFQFHHSFM